MAHLTVPTPSGKDEAHWRVKIDYLSATTGELHAPLPIAGKDGRTYSVFGGTAATRASLFALSDDRGVLWKDTGGRSGYAVSSTHEAGARIYFGHEKAPPLIEIGGAACDLLHANGDLLPFISRNTEGITRIDLAADIETSISPEDFVGAGRSSRQTSISRIRSAQGQTVYIGSPKSDRRLRVYRYEDPHPRSKFLRVECMLRDDLARSAATDVLCNGIAEAWRVAISAYGLEHPLIFGARTDRRFERTLRHEPTSAGKLKWIHKQVVPALRAAMASGLIDLATINDLLTAE